MKANSKGFVKCKKAKQKNHARMSVGKNGLYYRDDATSDDLFLMRKTRGANVNICKTVSTETPRFDILGIPKTTKKFSIATLHYVIYFWGLCRMINDKQLESAVGDCLSFTMNQQSVILEHREKSTIAQPEWSCWKTGLELSCYGVKLLRVCQLEDGVPFYGCPKGRRWGGNNIFNTVLFTFQYCALYL